MAIGVHREAVIPTVDGGLGPATALVAEAHAASLAVYAWNFRGENAFLPPALRVPPRDGPAGTPPAPGDGGDALFELCAHLDAGVDGLIADNPDTAVKACRIAREPVAAARAGRVAAPAPTAR